MACYCDKIKINKKMYLKIDRSKFPNHPCNPTVQETEIFLVDDSDVDMINESLKLIKMGIMSIASEVEWDAGKKMSIKK